MNNYLNAFILGLVEGITEFLPVSSTGHLLVAESLLKYHKSDAFNVLIQIGPIVAVTLVFWKYIVNMVKQMANPTIRDEFFKLSASFGITVILGFLAKILGLSLPDSVLPVAVATLVGAIVIFWIEHHVKNHCLSDKISWPVAFAVAFGQILAAVFPGTSRSGAAVMAALAMGVCRPSAVRFAFLVGIPTMFAAGLLQLREAISLGQTRLLFSTESLIAFSVATITAWLSVVWLLRYVQTRNFIVFAWYRLILGTALLFLMALKVVS